MTSIIRILCVGFITMLSASCGGSKNMTAEINLLKQKKAAIGVVSMSVTDYGGRLEWTSSAQVSDIIQQNMSDMVETVEGLLAEEWTVTPASTIVDNPGYYPLSIGRVFEGRTPTYSKSMPHFVTSRRDLVRATLAPDTAQKLCETLGLDAVVVVYSEWLVATGSMIPTSKPLTKNVLAIYDSRGRRLFFGRKDVQGTKTLGAMGMVKVDENTIGEWVDAFKSGITDVLAQMNEG